MSPWTEDIDDYADPHGELLARILRDEANTVVPAGDGLSRIRERIDTGRHLRPVWWRPALAAASTGLVAAGAVVAFELVDHTPSPTVVRPPVATQPAKGTTGPSTMHASPTPSSSATSATTLPAVPRTFVVAPVWPFASSADAAAWRTGGGGHQAWHLDPGATALAWLRTVLPNDTFTVASVKATADGGRDVAIASTSANGQPVTATIVHVVRYGGTGTSAPYEVTGATAPYTTFAIPAPGQRVSSPLAVRGNSPQGVDEGFETTIWNGIGDRQLGHGGITFGQGDFSASIPYAAPSSRTGFVTFVDRSASGVGITRIAAVPLTFSTVAPAVDYPPTFVGVKSGRAAVFYSKGGGFVRWLTPAEPGGGVQAVQLTDDRTWVYYLQGQGTCAASLWRVRYDGTSAPQPYLNPQGGPITAFALSADQKRLVYAQDNCKGQQTLGWRDVSGADAGTITIPSEPPSVLQLAWAPDDRHVALTIRTGMAWSVSTLDTARAKSLNDATSVPGLECGSGYCSAPAYAPDGSLVYATTDGQKVVVYRITAGKPTQLFTVKASPQVAALDLTADGNGVLVSDGNGSVWRWTASTGVHKISVTSSAGTW